MVPRFSLEYELRIAIQLSSRRLESANAAFEDAVLDSADGIASAHRNPRVREAVAEQTAALEQFRRSIDRWNHFILDGKLPVDSVVNR